MLDITVPPRSDGDNSEDYEFRALIPALEGQQAETVPPWPEGGTDNHKRLRHARIALAIALGGGGSDLLETLRRLADDLDRELRTGWMGGEQLRGSYIGYHVTAHVAIRHAGRLIRDGGSGIGGLLVDSMMRQAGADLHRLATEWLLATREILTACMTVSSHVVAVHNRAVVRQGGPAEYRQMGPDVSAIALLLAGTFWSDWPEWLQEEIEATKWWQFTRGGLPTRWYGAGARALSLVQQQRVGPLPYNDAGHLYGDPILPSQQAGRVTVRFPFEVIQTRDGGIYSGWLGISDPPERFGPSPAVWASGEHPPTIVSPAPGPAEWGRGKRRAFGAIRSEDSPPAPGPVNPAPPGQQPNPPQTDEPAHDEWGILEVVETVTTTHRVEATRSQHPVTEWMTDARAGGRKLWDEAGAHVKATAPVRSVTVRYRRPL